MITPVILCGGSGTRLWPLSRTSFPKQLLPLIDGKSLLQHTLLRIRDIPGVSDPIIVCNQDYRFLIAEQAREMGVKNPQIILEPEGKNTAPAVTIAALDLHSNANEKLMLVLPADHVITDHAKFIATVMQAAEIAKLNMMVTFGVIPTKPETGYGYIHKGEKIAADAYRVKQFVEKPKLASAENYIRSGEYYWNSGMFLFDVKTYLDEVAQHAPDILTTCKQCVDEMIVDLDFHRIKPELFSACRSESIDYAVMEKSNNIAVVSLQSDWSDLGSWTAMFDIRKPDEAGNVIEGDVVTYDVTNTYMHSENRLLAAVGVSDLAIIETADAVLVAHKNCAQDVKQLVGLLKSNKRVEVDKHKREYRPWGYYESLNQSTNYQVKQLVVKPGGKLSLQKHQFRSEHWVVIQGVATVTRGEDQFELSENQSTFIPAGVKHRLENNTATMLMLIEVQTGTYFGEDDIVRFEDIYHREMEKT